MNPSPPLAYRKTRLPETMLAHTPSFRYKRRFHSLEVLALETLGAANACISRVIHILIS